MIEESNEYKVALEHNCEALLIRFDICLKT